MKPPYYHIKKTSLLLAFIFIVIVVAQAQYTVPLNYWKKDEINQEVIISYDVEPQSYGYADEYNITIQAKNDGTVYEIPPDNLRGDYGNVKAGTSKKIIWDISDYGERITDRSMKFIITATPLNNRLRPMDDVVVLDTIPNLKPGLGVVAAGVLGGVLGGLRMGSAQKDYNDLYDKIRDPFDDAYKNPNLSRSDHFDEVNSNYKQGSTILIGSGIVVLAGGTLLAIEILQKRKNKKINKMNGITLLPYFEINSLAESTPIHTNKSTVGFNLSYQF